MSIISFPSNTDSPESYNLLPTEQQDRLQEWINDNLKPYEIKSFNEHHTSTQLKHAVPFYVTNGNFRGAMRAAGFDYKEISKRNCIFKLSKKQCDKLLDYKNGGKSYGQRKSNY